MHNSKLQIRLSRVEVNPAIESCVGMIKYSITNKDLKIEKKLYDFPM